MGLFTRFELAILDLIQAGSNPLLDKIMVDISTLGNLGIIWICLIIVFLTSKEYKTIGQILVLSFALNLIIVNLGLKNIVGRTRPYNLKPGIDLLIPALSDGSFPSGHSSYAASFATVVLVMAKSKALKVFTSTLAILIAISRLYLYVHFPSDVIGGIVVGFLISTLAMKFYFSDEFKETRNKMNLQRK